MSNVIIGLVGLVLFFGLAFAATTYLGPRLLGATATRNAQLALVSMQQTSAAIRIYRLKTRTVTPDTTQFINRLISAGVMRSAPQNPFLTAAPASATSAGAWPYPVYTANTTDSGILSASATSHTYLVMDLGSSNNARSACSEIQRIVGASTLLTSSTMSSAATFTSRRTVQPGSGCFRMSSGIDGIPANDYVAYLAD